MPPARRIAAWEVWAHWVAAPVAFALVWLALSSGPYDVLRERSLDWLIETAGGGRKSGDVVVVDIDRETLAADPRALQRERLAELIERIGEARPRAIALDILIDGADERSPAALARRLAAETQNAQFAALAMTLPDGDARFAAALAKAPVVLGAALSPEDADEQHATRVAPVLAQGKPSLGDAWQAATAIGPPPPIDAATRGVGALVLPGDQDARVRRVPLLVIADGRPMPGLAAETARVASDATAFLLSATPLALRIGPISVRMQSDAMLRLRPQPAEKWRQRTVSSARVMSDPAALGRLAGRAVLIGSSAPELGGLRPSAIEPLAPTVQLQADATDQILSGDVLRRPNRLLVLEVTSACLLGALALWLGLNRPPLRGFLMAAAAGGLWIGFSLVMARVPRLLVDPLGAPALLTAAFAGAALVSAARTLRREARLRQRFEQHLAPEIVRRIVERPDLLKLDGETREITALFTDVEGFTSMTERAGPQQLVAVLDQYFEGVTQVIVEHGGMVEKIVGDGLHALFNAPLDLADHPSRALDCALAVAAFSDRFQTLDFPKSLGFGRTRVGLETGMVVVGDIGGGRKLDYTAHGDAMNTAARLEAMNKELGSTICVGPVASARIEPTRLRSLGKIAVRGRTGGLEVFEPWPAAMSEADRHEYAEAIARAERDAEPARAKLTALAKRRPQDHALARLLDRLPGGV